MHSPKSYLPQKQRETDSGRKISLNLRQHLGAPYLAFSRKAGAVGETEKVEGRREKVVIKLKAGLQWFFLQQFERDSKVPNITASFEALE